MKRVISKRDGKTWFKTVAKFRASCTHNDIWVFLKGEIYWVRNADENDKVDPEKFVIVKGSFFNHADEAEWFRLQFTDYVTRMNGYNGTRTSGIPVTKDNCNAILEYID